MASPTFCPSPCDFRARPLDCGAWLPPTDGADSHYFPSARQFGVAILKKELSTIKLPDFSGSFKVGWIKSVAYDFYR